MHVGRSWRYARVPPRVTAPAAARWPSRAGHTAAVWQSILRAAAISRNVEQDNGIALKAYLESHQATIWSLDDGAGVGRCATDPAESV